MISGVSTKEGKLRRRTRLDSFEIRLLGSFQLLESGEPVTAPPGTQRLIAFLALNDRPVARPFVAGSLWPKVSDARAAANLRSALWRLRDASLFVVDDSARSLSIAVGVEVDVRSVAARTVSSIIRPGDASALIEQLTRDLLPDWYDDWLDHERERHRQSRLHALESLCEALREAGHFRAALEAALSATAADPLRESAQRAVITTYLAEGNASDAIRQYKRFRVRLKRDLGVSPSPLMERLVAPVLTRR